MANKKNENTQNNKIKINKNNNNTKKTSVNNINESDNIKNSHEKVKNTLIMKILVFLGVVIFCFVIIYLMYHFFVEKSDIKINMSTDKKIEYITLEGNEELIMTQKYVSDLSYSMRYDVTEFRVFKYNKQDIYKNLNDERVLVVVEKSMLPENCTKITSSIDYNNCYIKLDDYTEEYYITSNSRIYKITVKTPGTPEYLEGARVRIEHMINSFTVSR